MNSKLKSLEWDTQFFGFPVAELRTGDREPAHLPRVIEEARSLGATLLVYRVPHGTLVDCPDYGVLADTQHLYEMPKDRPSPTWNVGDAELTAYTETTLAPELAKLGVMAGSQSRFFHDPNFPNAAAEALYMRWMDRIVSKDFSERVHVLVERDENGEICAMGATYIDKDGFGVPSLMASVPGKATRGFGRAYFSQMMNWFCDEHVQVAQIKTQERCQIACKIYATAGWKLTRREDIYHVWLDQPTVKDSYL